MPCHTALPVAASLSPQLLSQTARWFSTVASHLNYLRTPWVVSTAHQGRSWARRPMNAGLGLEADGISDRHTSIRLPAGPLSVSETLPGRFEPHYRHQRSIAATILLGSA